VKGRRSIGGREIRRKRRVDGTSKRWFDSSWMIKETVDRGGFERDGGIRENSGRIQDGLD
jgi:hypothetical protein